MSTRKEKALENYTGKNGSIRLNCAQSLISAFNDENKYNLTDYEYCGAGNAPGGLCGAIYAASILSKDSNVIEKLSRSLGGVKCSELRNQRVSCLKCIEHSADILLK